MNLDSVSFPESWKVVPIPDVVFFQEGPGVRKHQYTDSGVKLLNGGNINDNNLNLDTTDRYVSEEEAYGKYSHFLVEEGDLLIACSGVVVEKFDGKIAYAREKDLPLCMNTSTMRFRSLNEKVLCLDYFKYFLQTRLFKSQLQKLITGSAQLNFGPSHIKQMEIPLPPLAEQKRIAAILDKADAIRRKRQQAIQLADDFLRAVFLDMFGDPVTNPKGWEVKPLGECLKFLTSGSRGWAKYYSETGSKFIRIQNVSKNKLLIDDMAFVTAPDGAEATRTKVRLDDVLLSITADLGRSSVVTDEIVGGHINQHLALLRLDTETLNPRYLSAYLSSDAGVRQFERKNKSAVKAGLNFTDIKTLEIMVPPIEKQAEYQKLYEKLTSNETKRIDSDLLLTTVFDALSQKAFRGEL